MTRKALMTSVDSALVAKEENGQMNWYFMVLFFTLKNIASIQLTTQIKASGYGKLKWCIETG